jgi:16S rRNA (guanine1207-N2)-methyltransferase
MSSAVYELLLRHPQLLDENTIILTAESDVPPDWINALRQSGSKVLSWDLLTAAAHRSLASGQVVHALPQAADIDPQQRVILIWPKSKVLAQALAELIANRCAEIWVAGENDAGGKSIGKALQAISSDANKVDSARRSSLWQLSLNTASDFNWLKLARSFNHNGHSYMTLPVVFNHGSLDVGTALLLEHVPAPPRGRLLDLGCGSGVIGLSMKLEEPALEVTLADIDAFAIRSTQLNSARLQAEADIVASDGLDNIDGRFDYLFSNPPFHQGKETDYAFARELFTAAGRHLTSDGQIWLVANRHLPYEDWAREFFAEANVMVQEKGFKLLCIHN